MIRAPVKVHTHGCSALATSLAICNPDMPMDTLSNLLTWSAVMVAGCASRNKQTHQVALELCNDLVLDDWESFRSFAREVGILDAFSYTAASASSA